MPDTVFIRKATTSPHASTSTLLSCMESSSSKQIIIGIRAYDSSQLTVDIANKHIEDRNERFEDFINENNVNQIASQGAINIPAFIKTDYGLYSMMWITNQVVTDQTGDISDIKEALTAIDDYLRRH